MKTQISGVGLKALINTTSLSGWVLLAKPLVSTIFSRRRDLDAYSSVDFSAIIFILYAIIAFIVGVNTLRKSKTGIGNEVLWRSPIVLFIIYSIYGVISMAWSVNAPLTGYRAFECIAMTVLIVAVIQDLLETGELKFVILWSLLYCTEDVIFAIYRTSQWATNLGDYLESSQMMATTFFFMALYFTPYKWFNYLIITMSIVSLSTVSYIGMAIGLVSSFWRKGNAKVLAIVGALIVILAAIAIGPYNLVKQTVFFDKEDISLAETSGRDHLMSTTEESVKQHPFGLGFFAAEPYVFYSLQQNAITAHNSIFSAGLGLGIPGIGILSLFFIVVGIISFSSYVPDIYKAIGIGCVLVALIQCMGNPSVGTRVFGAWMPCMYIFVLNSGMYIYGKYYEEKKMN